MEQLSMRQHRRCFKPLKVELELGLWRRRPRAHVFVKLRELAIPALAKIPCMLATYRSKIKYVCVARCPPLIAGRVKCTETHLFPARLRFGACPPLRVVYLMARVPSESATRQPI
ncbi:hypothetical protein EVAR_69388_1 [Eumeta japonica]|uniref:Uncharacterized protein n=1 Tax=Eumeta variegata TaxID=151549 RepID=A0A4C1ZXL8_EUMVA|nr:hypothetical protein EVAR_69388_1 [Eumeta japonica]